MPSLLPTAIERASPLIRLISPHNTLPFPHSTKSVMPCDVIY